MVKEITGKALLLLELSVINAPPLGAAPLRPTVSVAELPLVMLVGLIVKLLIVGLLAAGLTVTWPSCE
jgi:hypothetical protein